MTNDSKLSYLAGLFDGEGSFSLQALEREYKGTKWINFAPKMSMTLQEGNEILDLLKKELGGSIYSYDNGKTRRWNLFTRETCENATKILLPYLRIKKQIAKRFLKALSYFPKSRKSHSDHSRSWTAEMIRKVGMIAITLNPSTARRSKLKPQDIDRLSEVYERYDES